MGLGRTFAMIKTLDIDASPEYPVLALPLMYKVKVVVPVVDNGVWKYTEKVYLWFFSVNCNTWAPWKFPFVPLSHESTAPYTPLSIPTLNIVSLPFVWNVVVTSTIEPGTGVIVTNKWDTRWNFIPDSGQKVFVSWAVETRRVDEGLLQTVWVVNANKLKLK